MNAKDYLKRYNIIEREIASKNAELKAKKPYAELSENKEKINKLISSIQQDILELIKVEDEIRHTIKSIDNSYYRTILTEIYINGCTLEEVAEKINYGYKQTCRLHGKALLAVKDVLECPINKSI